MTTIPTESQFDQLLEEFLDRHRRGEKPNVGDYVDRHPEWAVSIEQFFPAVAAMEDLGTVLTPTGSATAANRPTKLGEYRIVREVGRGGMGVVYEAVQESLGRHVALKVLPPGQFSSGVPLQRFVREAQTAARLHHTNIVPVFGVGADQGTYFFAMQFIQGHGLNVVLQEIRQLKQNTGPIQASPTVTESSATLIIDRQHSSGIAQLNQQQYYRNIARLMMQAADALAYAHAHGVLHRDIKPSNLILDVHSTLWITDFGLAKSEGSEDLSRTGDVVGTLRYMAPERFQGICTERSDVYSLGATLYEMVALQTAFSATDKLTLLADIQHGSCPRPRTVDATVPTDLELIINKAMALVPQDRYSSAAEMGEDLQRFLDDRAIVASRPSVFQQLSRWARKRPGLAASLAMLFLSFLAVSLLALVLWRTSSQLEATLLQTQEQRAKANQNLDQLQKAMTEMLNGIKRFEREHGVDQSGFAKQAMRLSLPFLEYIASQKPSDTLSVIDQIRTHQELAAIYREDDRLREAEQEVHKAIAMSRQLVKDHPEEVRNKMWLAFSLHHMSATLDRKQLTARDLQYEEEALELVREVQQEHPKNMYNMGLLATLLINKADREKNEDIAIGFIQEAWQLTAELAASPNATMKELLAHAESVRKLATYQAFHNDIKQVDPAIWSEPEQAIKKLLDQKPRDSELRFEWAWFLEDRGRWHRERKELQEAAAYHDEALRILVPLVKEFPFSRYRVKLAGAYCNRGYVYNLQNEYALALPLLDRAAEEIEFVLTKEPDRHMARNFAYYIYDNRAKAHKMLGHFRETAADWKKVASLTSGTNRVDYLAAVPWALAHAKDYSQAEALVTQLVSEHQTLSGAALYNCAAALGMSCSASSNPDPRRMEELSRLLVRYNQSKPMTQEDLRNNSYFKGLLEYPSMRSLVDSLPAGNSTRK